ncbi:MAG: lysophospholipid acyltransferase family protein [Vicingaceae bacterium]|nr:1-acyl-sn-glycerol-3-phosphate acyltransferase [Flavobacteriales bacterium]MBL1233930.1 1-acyl-sn-glycerol-3-phosphate acyltransferase [Flavobacteriales bacterium]MDF1674760.1 lysophospholipid acyltransferase family protein [Vicingaceae bacterium]
MISYLRITLMIIWTFSLMLIAPLFIPFVMNRQFPLMVARTVFAPVLMKIAGIDISVSGKENVPTDKPVIFVSNHFSHLDIGCLCYSLPKNLHFIGKKELIWTPVVGWYMWVAGHIFVDRTNKKKALKSITKAAKKISEGKSVVLFAEGTRSKTGKVESFKKGAFHLALQAGVDIVPVSIKGTYEVWKSGTNTITPGKVSVIIGKPIDSSKFDKNNINNFVTAVRESIIAMQ